MSTNKKIWTDGEALTTTELQRSASIGAGGDDRAWEGLFTPGSVQKKIVPLLEESTSINPRLLAVPGVGSGSVKLQPCLLIAGGSGLPNHINLSAKLESSLDSALFGANSSGSTRYDLLYATIAYATSVTGSRKVKDVTTGSVSTQSLVLEKVCAPTLTILPNVGNVTPTATMPADAVDGSSYNFPVALVAVPNGYASASAITQAMITALWSGAWVAPPRLKSVRPASIFYGAATEKVPSALANGTPGAERWGGENRFFGMATVYPSTSATPATGTIVDATIDWRNRFIYGFWSIGTRQTGVEGTAALGCLLPSLQAAPGTVANNSIFPIFWSGSGNIGGGSNALLMTYIAFAPLSQSLYIDSAGILRIYRISAPNGGAGGDPFVFVLCATDQLQLGI